MFEMSILLKSKFLFCWDGFYDAIIMLPHIVHVRSDSMELAEEFQMEKYLNMKGFLKKSLKNRSALKSTGESLALKSALIFLLFSERQGQWLSGIVLDL